jgi:histidinol-phosphate aminotransferase
MLTPKLRGLIPDYIRDLEPYRAGRTIQEVQEEFGLESVVKLASNENPLGPPQSALEAASRSLASGHRYPDPAARALRGRLAERYDLQLENIIVGAGSEGILASIVRVFLEREDQVLTADAAFWDFPFCAVPGVWSPLRFR